MDGFNSTSQKIKDIHNTCIEELSQNIRKKYIHIKNKSK